MKINQKLLKNLVSIPGVSGNEINVTKFIEEEVKKVETKIKYNIEYDNLGSLIINLKSNNKNVKNILFDSHVDEVGFKVVGISENGMVSFEEMGYISKESLLFKNVNIVNSENQLIPGYIFDPGFMDSLKVVKIEKLKIDLGVKTKKDVIEKLKINIGDQIVFDTNFNIDENVVRSKAIDNRLGTYMNLNLLLKILKENMELNNNFTFVFSTQEEVGLRGARTAAYRVNPDIAVVIDISPSRDHYGKSETEGILGKGTMLRHKDAYSLYQKRVIKYLRNLMVDNKIKYQDYISQGGTNAGIIQMNKGGVITVPIGLVARNIHTNNTIAEISDIVETEKLLYILVKDLDENNDKIIL